MNESARRLGKFAGMIGLVMMILGKNIYHPTNGALSMVFWTGVALVVIGVFSLRSSQSTGG